MKMHLLIGVAMALSLCGAAMGAGVTDVVEYSTGYFVPDSAQTYDAPYYRWYDEDWSWTHSAISGSFTSAGLLISAWDVDASSGEVDNIYAYDTATTTWVLLGSLEGSDNAWDYTTFELDLGTWADDIAAGLQVKIDIDATNDYGYDYWAVTLAKSVLTTDGGIIPDPDPNPSVPEPASMSLIGIGVMGLIRLRKKLFC
jgi:hypothetical protein